MQPDTTDEPKWLFNEVRAEKSDQHGKCVCFRVAEGWPTACMSVAEAERLAKDLREAARRAENADFGRPVDFA